MREEKKHIARLNELDNRLAAVERRLSGSKNTAKKATTSHQANRLTKNEELGRLLGATLVFVLPAALLRTVFWIIAQLPPDGTLPSRAVCCLDFVVGPSLVMSSAPSVS